MYKTSVWYHGALSPEPENRIVYSGSIRFAWKHASRGIPAGAKTVFIHTPEGKQIRVW